MFSILREICFRDVPKLSPDFFHVTEYESTDLGVDLNLASLWEVRNIPPAFEKNENANERGKG